MLKKIFFYLFAVIAHANNNDITALHLPLLEMGQADEMFKSMTVPKIKKKMVNNAGCRRLSATDRVRSAKRSHLHCSFLRF